MPKRWFEKVENKTEFFAKRVAKQSNGKETQSTTRPSSLHCIGRKINYMFEEKGDSRELSVGESSHHPFVFIHKSLGFFFIKEMKLVIGTLYSVSSLRGLLPYLVESTT